jgi:hypothetical protein
MKTRILLFAILAALTLHAAPPREPQSSDGIDETSQFIFFAVLEGLYADGVSNDEVSQILMKREGETYFHFIYSCPVCNATIWALEAYKARPDSLYGLKRIGNTFGPGIPLGQRDNLFGDDAGKRLTVINALVKKWIERRMKPFPAAERKTLAEQLEKKREEGMKALESFRKKKHGENFGIEKAAPAFVNLKECAACNAVTGRAMDLPKGK